MADAWLAHEVLRELDEAGACYFPLTLRSQSSSTYLEIPATFTTETGWPRFDECALVTSMTFAKEWPLQFRRYASFHTGVGAVSVGGGWAKFVEDHNLGEGAFLTFEVVDDRSLVVALHARGALGSHERSQEEQIVEPSSPCPWSEHVPPPEDNRHTRKSICGVPTELARDHPPQFQKTLRKTHMKKNDLGRLDVPTPYWRTHGAAAFDGQWCTLNGPLSTWSVRTSTHTSKVQRFCSFTKGFAGFCAANELKLGDRVQFTKVGLLEFEVRKVDRWNC